MVQLQETIVQWQDPAGQWHQPGEVATLDEVTVFDWPDLVKEGTILVTDIPAETPPPPQGAGE